MNPISICIWNPFVFISISNLISSDFDSNHSIWWSDQSTQFEAFPFPNSKILISTNQLQMFSIFNFHNSSSVWLLKSFFLLRKPTFQHALQNQHLCLKHICIYVSLCVGFLFHIYILHIWRFFHFRFTFLRFIFTFMF